MTSYERVVALLSEQCSVPQDKITPDSDIVKDLGADSLDIVGMLMQMEEEFGVEIEEDVATQLKTVQDVVNAIDNYKK